MVSASDYFRFSQSLRLIPATTDTDLGPLENDPVVYLGEFPRRLEVQYLTHQCPGRPDRSALPTVGTTPTLVVTGKIEGAAP
jgi:hypothetical protein